MTYNYPTKEGIEFAMDWGWTREQAERGFEIFDFDRTGMLGIEAICDCYPNNDYDDEAAAREAERIGFCKIIPVDELPDPFIYDGISRRYFGWVDTPENRKRIEDYCKKETEYPVIITEKFNKLIVVKANSEEEAIEKCWNEFSNGCLFNNSPVSIDYLTCDSDVDFEIGTEKDRKLIEEDEDRFDYLD